jgi:4a-hydroxytetrahydrobiopterin dehydratase
MALLSDAEVQDRLARASAWRRAAGEGPAAIERDVELADFAAALDFVNRVGAAAEEAGHHPDILLHGWNKVRLTLSTHSQGGLTEADLELAARIDGLV